MKVRKEDLQIVREDPIELFYQGIKSSATKDKYTRTLRRTLCDIFEDILEGTFENRAETVVKKGKSEPEWLMSLLLSLSKKLKERTNLNTQSKDYLNPQSFDNYFKPLRKLLDMNDVPVVWSRIYATYPESSNKSSTRGYTLAEIQKLISFASGPIDKAIILIAASSGIREGGFSMTWEDVSPVYIINNKYVTELTETQENVEPICAILRVYKGTNEEYPAFITPEAYKALMDYRTSWIQDTRKEPKPDEPLFKQEGWIVKRLSPEAIKQRVDQVARQAGMRMPLAKGKKRHNVPIMNGFRRFFNKVNKETLSKDSPLAALIKKEYMMAHTGLVKLDRNYFQAHIHELIEEYLNAIPNLTISDEERVKVENRKLRKEKSELEDKNQRIAQLENQMDIILHKLDLVSTTSEMDNK